MNKTSKSIVPYNERLLVDIPGLMEMLSCGRNTALKIAKKAKCEVRIGRRRLFKVQAINKYLNDNF